MHKTRLHLHGRNSMLAVACVAIAWFAISPGNISAAGKPSPAPANTAQAPGRLIITRSAHLGSITVNLKIDGVQTATIFPNRRYDAPLAAGPHVLTVSPVSRFEQSQPTEKRLTVEPSKTYALTAVLDDVQIVLK
jgi:hypothetical protein